MNVPTNAPQLYKRNKGMRCREGVFRSQKYRNAEALEVACSLARQCHSNESKLTFETPCEVRDHTFAEAELVGLERIEPPVQEVLGGALSLEKS